MALVLPFTQAFTWDRFGLGPLPRLARLTSLKFEVGVLDHINVAALTRSLGLLTDLKRLELLSLTGCIESDLSVFSAGLAGLVSLEHLVLECIGLNTEDVNRMLPSLTALQSLDLHFNGLTSSDIAPALAALRALTHLDLNENVLWAAEKGMISAEEGMVSISASLSLLTRLVYLDLNYNGSGVCCGAAAIAALGHSLPPSLTHLSVAENYLGADGVLAFAPGLRRLTALRFLNLSGNIYDDEVNLADRTSCLPALAGCLQCMTALASLHLSANCLGPDCVPTLAGVLNLQQIQDVDLSFNKLGVRGAQLLAACLPRMPRIRELDLSGNDFGDNGFAALADSLVNLPSLTSVDVSCNELTMAAVEALTAALHATGSSHSRPAAMEKLDLLILLNFSVNEISRVDVAALERPGRTIIV